MTITDYGIVIAAVIWTLSVYALWHERHSASGSRYLLIIIVIAATISGISAGAMSLPTPWPDVARFVNAALRSVVFILLLGFIIQRPRHVR